LVQDEKQLEREKKALGKKQQIISWYNSPFSKIWHSGNLRILFQRN
jgi:hypothetical protein